MTVEPGDVAPDSVRVSDADRESVIELLKERVADGTLILDEFVERAGHALTARTRGELDKLTADLAAMRAPVDGRRTSPTHTVVAVMSGAGKKGRWRCGSRVVAVAVMGGCHLDFRGAEIDSSDVHVLAVAVMGGIDIIVPEGIEVSLDGLAVMGGKSAQIKNVPVLPGSPRIHVHAYPVMGGVTVRSRRRRTEAAVADADHVAVESGSTLPIDGTVTLMFSDVSDYSGITERLGDVAANDLLREYVGIVQQSTAAQSGHVVKSHGDGLMVAFPSVVRALRAAVDIQQTLAKRNVESTDEPLRVHIGIHAGEVVREGDDYLGSAVIIASRLADVAGPDEILVSAVARELAAGVREFSFDAAREVTLKGLGQARAAFPVAWQSAPR